MYSFFALLSRMKYIARWGLMRNTWPENVGEHSMDVAVLAHALAVLRNARFGGHMDEKRVMELAAFHDVGEILTGDLPTPIKYYSPALRGAYRDAEQAAAEKLLLSLPEDLRPAYWDLLLPRAEEKELWRVVKAADKLSALIKCIEEEKAGNAEFHRAASAQRQSLEQMHLPEVDCFLAEFLPAYRLTLDEQEPAE